MQTMIPLANMSTAEKLQAIEEIWADLARTSAAIPSPAWHKDVLDARENRIGTGQSQFLPLDDAKAKLRARLQ